MFRRSLRHHQENSYNFSKPSAYCKFVRVAELQGMKYTISCFLTDLFKDNKKILARCYGLKAILKH